ncbi:hypothetical protein IJ21_04000 [Paenibacillus sp. 32O-W]|uniref:hypothetical protein n=1 Tax=Paenibacillus sp. 32O-W TaxID=1695218 RepID=UPI0007205270|nr:hypothetical protein [Paenibacillus sp. 32O-W]ALS25832.1 hypothetical protein IJ21_04000 [Paenibacillus sp. 32O-W]
MWKWAEWLAKTVAAGLIISFLSIWTTGYIVNSYVETLLKQYNVPLEVTPFALSGVWGKLWGADGEIAADSGGKSGAAETKGDSGTGANGAEAGGQEGAGGGETPNRTAEGALEESQEDAAEGKTEGETGEAVEGAHEGTAEDAEGGDPVATDDAFGRLDEADGDLEASLPDEDAPLTGIGSGSGPKANSGTSGGETALTPEELNAAKDRISADDKAKIFVMLTDKLPEEAWQTLSGYVEDGLTEQEMLDIQQIVAQHLDKAEYEELMNILKKY